MVKRPLIALIALFVLVCCLVAACGARKAEAPPAAPPGQASTPAAPANVSAQGITGDTLPGRLLFVQQGTIWLWQGNRAAPLIGGGKVWQPAWSPDGTRIAYIERGESYSDVMLADASGRHLDQLTFNGSKLQLQSRERIYDTMWAFYPTWAPDGSYLIIAAQYAPPFGSPAVEYNLSIFRLALDGSSTRYQLYADTTAHCGKIAFPPRPASASSRARQLVFTHASTEQEGFQQLHLLNLATNESTPLPGAPPSSYDPAFSRDGRWLVFTSANEGKTDIWLLPAPPTSGTPTPRRLTTLGTARAPAFSPDGTMLAFLAIPPDKGGFELWVASLTLDESGNLQLDTPRQVTRDMYLDADSGVSWAP
jgi:TolB protein